MGTEAVALLEATQETPPDFPVDIPPQTFSEEPPTGPRQAGGGGAAPGLGGGDGSTPVEEPLPEVLEGTPLPEDALAFSTVMTPSETLAAPTETLLAAPTEAALAAAPALGESQELAAQEEAPVAAPAQGWSTWRWVEAALAIIALVAGGLAFYLRRQGRA